MICLYHSCFLALLKQWRDTFAPKHVATAAIKMPMDPRACHSAGLESSVTHPGQYRATVHPQSQHPKHRPCPLTHQIISRCDCWLQVETPSSHAAEEKLSENTLPVVTGAPRAPLMEAPAISRWINGGEFFLIFFYFFVRSAFVWWFCFVYPPSLCF